MHKTGKKKKTGAKRAGGGQGSGKGKGKSGRTAKRARRATSGLNSDSDSDMEEGMEVESEASEEESDGKDEPAEVAAGVMWRCPVCVQDLMAEQHHTDHPKYNLVFWLVDSLCNAIDVCGTTNGGGRGDDDEVDEEKIEMEGMGSAHANKGLKARLESTRANLELAFAHKMRTHVLAKSKPRTLETLDHCTVLALKDYMGKLEARKINQGTAENMGKKLSNHGSVYILRNPPQHIRANHPEIEFSSWPPSSDDCLVQVTVFSASDDSSQSAYHMGCTAEVEAKEVRLSFPWITNEVVISDQCSDYHSTAAAIFNHEKGRLTGLHTKAVHHTEAGEGKNETDMQFGHLSQQFQHTMAKLDRNCASQLFDHLELAGVGYNIQCQVDR